MIWRLVAGGMGTKSEIEREWSLLDVFEAHQVLNKLQEQNQNDNSGTGNKMGVRNRH